MGKVVCNKAYVDSVGCLECPHSVEHRHDWRCFLSCRLSGDAECIGACEGNAASSEGDIPQHEPGAKLDKGKPRVAMWMRTVPNAIWEVSRLATMGAEKYTPYGCLEVQEGTERYPDAMMRHFIKDAANRKSLDKEMKVMHLTSAAWNAMMTLELELREDGYEIED